LKRIIVTEEAPRAIGPYSQAVQVDGLLFISGQIGLDPSSGQLVGPDAGEQTERCLRNLEAVLVAAGLTLGNVVKTTVFLSDMANFREVNEAYGSAFGIDPPARSTVAVSALPLGAKVEIDALAVRDHGPG
jgi:2-iminobutanoate/2-iminopropanoate deaminase